ncbi:MAG TPA: hypothetical protein PLC39_02655 [Methanomassiliicoccales archaeon]|nr:hypothetical protein [Methanomassiliicoccales archaeon]HPR98183.1 hypothetical protein [Methanomassiliicoccales archaeon]
MVFRRSADADDEITNTLIDRGVYRLSEVYEDEEIKKFKDLKAPYSFWSAVKYSLILTVLLWWLPVFGQMVAGFVSGRRAGKPWKGVVAALVPLTIVFILSLLVDNGIIPSVINGVDWTPSHILEMAKDMIPLLAPYILFVEMYLTAFIDTIQIATDLRVDVYIITAAFAYIGGILAEQSRLEMNYVAKHGGNSMTVMVGGGEKAAKEEVAEERPARGKRPVSAKQVKTRQAQKVIRFGDLKDLTTASDEDYVQEYTERGEQWYEEGEEPDEDVPKNIAGLAKRSSPGSEKGKKPKPGDWKFI